MRYPLRDIPLILNGGISRGIPIRAVSCTYMFIKVFVTPGAKRERVEVYLAKKVEEGETLTIAVKEPALGNRANDRVREIIAEREKVPFGNVRILTGHRSRAKMISVTSKRASEG